MKLRGLDPSTLCPLGGVHDISSANGLSKHKESGEGAGSPRFLTEAARPIWSTAFAAGSVAQPSSDKAISALHSSRARGAISCSSILVYGRS